MCEKERGSKRRYPLSDSASRSLRRSEKGERGEDVLVLARACGSCWVAVFLFPFVSRAGLFVSISLYLLSERLSVFRCVNEGREVCMSE